MSVMWDGDVRVGSRSQSGRLATVLVVVLAGVGIVGLVLLGIMRVADARDTARAEPAGPAAIAAFEESLGIRLGHIGLVADGGIVQVRYRVVDVGRAAPLAHAVAIVDEDSGTTLKTRFEHGGHGNHELAADRVYTEMIINAAGSLQRGDLVTLKVGEHEIEHLVAQ
jgi:hypothetical protein